jgi:hypothetical protein
MPKDTNYSLAQIKKNLSQFYKKILDKNLDENFWIIADRSDFQPLKRIIKSQIRANTRLANKKKNSKTGSKKVSKKGSKAGSKKGSKAGSKKGSKVGSRAGSKIGSKLGSRQLIKKVNIHSIKELKDHFLEGKGEYYKEKKFANIKITMNESILEKISDIKNYKDIKNEPIITVQITMFKVSSSGYLNFNEKTELKVKYVVDDFRNLIFKLKNIEVLMRLLADSVIKTSGSSGISYKMLLEKINKKK